MRSGVGERERARRDVGEYSPRLWPATKRRLDAPGREEPLRGDADGENGRLCVRGQHQLIVGAFETETAQRPSKRRVRFVEELAADRKGFGERLPHADFLRALAGKDERDHWFRPTRRRRRSRARRVR